MINVGTNHINKQIMSWWHEIIYGHKVALPELHFRKDVGKRWQNVGWVTYTATYDEMPRMPLLWSWINTFLHPIKFSSHIPASRGGCITETLTSTLFRWLRAPPWRHARRTCDAAVRDTEFSPHRPRAALAHSIRTALSCLSLRRPVGWWTPTGPLGCARFQRHSVAQQRSVSVWTDCSQSISLCNHHKSDVMTLLFLLQEAGVSNWASKEEVVTS